MSRLPFAAALLIGAAPAAFAAQPDIPRERTGPDADPQPLPPYPTTVPAPIPTEGPAAPAPATGAGTVAIGDVQVTTDPAGTAGAQPRSGWAGGEDGGTGLRLDHTPGDALDAAWVRRQFVANGLIGAETGYDRIVALVQLINRAFIQNGFVNSGVLIPAQPPLGSGGTLQLTLVYGRLVAPAADAEAVAIRWRDGRSAGLGEEFVRARMRSAERMPFNALALERDFRLLADDPAIRTLNADLQPGTHPGEAHLLLMVDPQPRADLYLTAANSRSPSVGGERIAIGGSLRNLLAGGDVLSGEYGRTDGLTDATLGYATSIFTPELILSVRGSLNDAAVVDRPLRPLDISSRDRSIEGGFNYRLVDRPLTPSATPGRWTAARTVSVGVLATHRVSRSYLLGLPFSFSPGSVDGRAEYTALRFTGDWLERNVDQVLALSVTGTLGLEGTRSEFPVPSPPRNFRSLLVQANYARRLDDKGLELRARMSGQWTDDVLYSAERLSVGGENSVRGYRENLILADRGITGSIELSQPFSVSGGRRNPRGDDWGAFTITGFLDGAVTDNVNTVDPRPRSIASVGASLTWTPTEALFARITYGAALKDARIAGSDDLQDKGFQFRLTFRPLTLWNR